MSTARQEPVRPPDAAYVRQRWIQPEVVAWVEQCDQIMIEHGMVVSSTTYPERYRARHGARKLIRLMVELRKHERWQLVEHTSRKDGGWIWTVEYIRRRDDG